MRAWLESDEITAYTVAGDWPTPDTASLWAHFRTEALRAGIQNGLLNIISVCLIPRLPLLLVFIGSSLTRGRTDLAGDARLFADAAFKKSAVDPKPSLFSGRVPGNTVLVDVLRIGRGKLRWPPADA